MTAKTQHRTIAETSSVTDGTESPAIRPTVVHQHTRARSTVAGRPGPAIGRLVAAIGQRTQSAVRATPGLIRTVPFTTTLIVVMMLVATVTGAFSGANGGALSDRMGYGLPALTDSGFWRFLVGASILPHPTQYLVMTPLIALAIGYFERRVGALRAAVTLLVTHLAGTVGVAALLSIATQLDWPWAGLTAGATDLGISAGTIGVLAAASCLMSPTLRRRIRWVGAAYLLVMVLRSGLLWDAEHLLGAFTGLLIGPLLIGAAVRPANRKPQPRIKLIRSGIAWAMVVLAASRLVTAFYPGNGGVFGNGVAVQQIHPGMIAGALIAGGITLLVANALRRGLPVAWWAAVAVAALNMARAGVMSHSHYPADLLLWGLLLAALVAGRGYWPWRLPTEALRRALPRLLVAAGGFIGGSTLLLWLLRSQLPPDTTAVHARQIISRAVFNGASIQAHTRTADTLLHLTAAIWGIALLFLLVPLLYASHVPGRRERIRMAGRLTAKDRLIAMITLHGGGNLGWQRTWPTFTSWDNAAHDVLVGYRVVSGVAIVVGDPVGPRHKWKAAAAEFQRFCLLSGWTPAWYAVTDHFLEAVGDSWQHTQIGEDAVIELPELAFTGKSWQDVRTARNRAEREGIRCVQVDLATADPDLLAGIDEVSRAWANGKPLPEMGFTLGTIELAKDGAMRTHVAIGDDGVVHGVTTWMPVHENGRVIGWTLDVMRRRTDGFRPVMEFLIAESVLTFQREGCDLASLSVAPLARPMSAGTADTTTGMDRLDRALDRMGEMLEPAYGFRSLLAYKTKFHPRFAPVHLAYGFQVDLAEIAVAIGRAYLPELSAGQAMTIARALRPGRREPAAVAA